MTDTNTPAAAEPPVQPKWKKALVWAAKQADAFGAWFKKNVWDSGLARKSVTVPVKAMVVGVFLIVGAGLFVKIVHKAAPVVAETVGIEAPAQCAPKTAELPKSSKPVTKKSVSKPAKARHETQSLGFFN